MKETKTAFPGAIEVTEIGCDKCGLIAPASEFAFGEDDPRFAKAVAIGGFDLNDLEDLGHVQTMSAGIACLSCGNFSSFDTHPNDSIWPPEPENRLKF